MRPRIEGAGLPLPEQLGRYRIVALLGSGSFAQVFEAVHVETGVTIALKVYHAQCGDLGPRADRETDLLLSLVHPGIARLVESGCFETSFGPRRYVAMQLVEGRTLRELCHAGRSSIDRALELLAELAGILSYAHRQGVVHRDLKPENIIVRPDGAPVILDFGLARRFASDGEVTISTIGTVIGSFRYMSPEQARSDPAGIGPATDIYALGVIAFELLSGELPYPIPSDNRYAAIVAISTTAPGWLGDVTPECSGAIEAIVMRALEKDPADRYASATAMASDFRRVLAGRLPSASTLGRSRRGVRLGWRRLRAHPGALRRKILPAAAAVLVLAAVGLRLTVSRAPKPSALEVENYFELLETADALRHAVDPWETGQTGAVAADACQRPIAMFEAARETWSRLHPRPDEAAEAELQYIEWRLAELRFFVGEALHDPAATERACAQFEQANGHDWPLFDPHAKPASKRMTTSRVRAFGPQTAPGGCALCEGARARYDEPAIHLQRALDYQRAALRAFDAAVARYPRYPLTQDERNGTVRGLALASLRAGIVCDSLEWIDAGRRQLDELALQAHDGTARAALLHDTGRAWRARAEITGAATDADSAQVRLALALRDRPPGRDRWDTMREMAFASLTAASLEPSRVRVEEGVRRVLLVAADTLGARDRRGDRFFDALTGLSLADLYLRLADLVAPPSLDHPTFAAFEPPPDWMRRLLEACEERLEEAATGLADPRYTVARAELALHRGHLRRLQATAPTAFVGGMRAESPDPDLAATFQDLERALAAVPVAASPRLHRLIRAEVEAFGSIAATR